MQHAVPMYTAYVLTAVADHRPGGLHSGDFLTTEAQGSTTAALRQGGRGRKLGREFGHAVPPLLLSVVEAQHLAEGLGILKGVLFTADDYLARD